MNIQDCIKLLTAHNGWTFKGSFMQVHPICPNSCGGGGGLRERRYMFSADGQEIHFNTRSVRWRAQTIQQVQAGDKYVVHHYT